MRTHVNVTPDAVEFCVTRDTTLEALSSGLAMTRDKRTGPIVVNSTRPSSNYQPRLLVAVLAKRARVVAVRAGHFPRVCPYRVAGQPIGRVISARG